MNKGKQIESTDGAWLRLLALDGGGVRGLSSLMVLQQLMEAIDPDAPPKPCDYFHMIGGTSTGGLIAIMLGRLKMSVHECIAAYTALSSKVFEKQRHRVGLKGNIQGRFNTEALEQVVKQMLAQQGLSEDALLKDSPDAACKVFVCATSKHNPDTVCLTSYRSPRGGSHLLNSVKIWEACRATSAATSFFDPIALGPFREEFIDGALGANNPIYTLWNQAQDLWGGGSLQDKLLCLVSIGTGIPSQKPFSDNVLQIGKAIIALSTETERTAEQFSRDKATLDDEGRYYRFNVSQGLEGVGLEESTKVNEIAAATLRYITSQAVFKQMKACTKALSGQGHFITNPIAFNIENASVISASLMDPITLTSSVLAGVSRATDTLRSCQRYAARFKIADLSVASLHTECSTIRLGLRQIKKLITSDGNNTIEDRFEAYVLEEYDGVLQACCLPFSILNAHLESLDLTQVKEMSQNTFTAKLQSVWSHPQMDNISQNIIGLARAIGILCLAFQSETTIKTSEIMKSPEAKAVLASVSSDAISLHESLQTAPGIEESSTSSQIGDEAFVFDNILINTTLYRRAFARQMAKSKQREFQDHNRREEAVLPAESEAVGTSSGKAPLELRVPLVSERNVFSSHPTLTRGEPEGSLARGLESKPDNEPESLFETAASGQESYEDFYTLDDAFPTNSRTNLAMIAVEQMQLSQNHDRPILELPSLAAADDEGKGHGDVTDPLEPAIEKGAAPGERRISVHSQSSIDTVRDLGILGAANKSTFDPARKLELDSDVMMSEFLRKDGATWSERAKKLTHVSPSAHEQRRSSGTDESLGEKGTSSLLDLLDEDPIYTPPLPPSPARSTRLPTLFEVLSRRTLKPYTLFDFYLYMRDIQRAVDYLDFWLDVAQHMSLCRHYVRELRKIVIMPDDPDDALGVSSVAAQAGENRLVARADIRASAEKILYTFLLSGSEREIVLPRAIIQSITVSIEEQGRDDPEVFDEAKDYVFQAMERDAFPGFLNLSRPVFRLFRKSKSLGPLVNRLSIGNRYGYVPTPTPMQRIPPEQLFRL